MTPVSDIVRTLMIQLGLGTTNGVWPIFVSFLPDVDSAIVVYDTAGILDGRILRSGEQIEKPGIQIRVRAPRYIDAQRKAREIAHRLDLVQGAVVSTDSSLAYIVYNISRRGDVINLGPEEEAGSERRFNFTINAIVTHALEV